MQVKRSGFVFSLYKKNMINLWILAGVLLLVFISMGQPFIAVVIGVFCAVFESHAAQVGNDRFLFVRDLQAALRDDPDTG